MKIAMLLLMALVGVSACGVSIAWLTALIQYQDYGAPLIGFVGLGVVGIVYLVLSIGYARHLLKPPARPDPAKGE